ncbi:MAG TPA: phosphoglycerate dehydrogenase [Candidatus Levilactobacillus faecigallinarum]|uniref:Phosphoglycerate dehydrogenase n=1 Tax=Candidatus Levilactobacillus faecigallinarum TaxID=2838638 RepID=A0A9D1U4X1_9LACO|nr:phosphoglycerate dehydrogenase [Candidatus Levilactobacillus faecigallinarum]
MTERILALQPLAADQLARLQATDAELVTAADYQTAGPITIIYGWDRQIGPAVLKDPKNSVHWIQTASAGIDYLPLDWIIAHNVALTNASGVYSAAIAESTLGYLLYFLRGFNEAVKNQAGHFWFQPARDEMFTLASQKVVIYGTGSIGQAIAKLLNGFGNQPFGVNRSGHPVDGFQQTASLDNDAAVLQDADVVINVMPATKATVHYFDQAFFDRLNGLRVFVNVGRGDSVDTQALMHALLYQNVLHAALDVFEEEPLPRDSKLWDYPNVLITPHQTGFAGANNRAIFDLFAQNLTSLLKDGQLSVNVVDPAKGY